MLVLRRAFAMFIDVIIAAAVTSPLGVVAAFLELDFLMDVSIVISFLLFFFKDLYNYQGSIGKKTIGLELLFTSSLRGKEKNYFLVIRNLSLILWPLEGIIAFLNKGRRIGDLIAKTKVISSPPTD